MNDFSLRVYKVQKALGVKRKEEIARKLGVSRTMLYNYEQADPPPSAGVLSRLDDLEQEAGIEQMPNRVKEDWGLYAPNHRSIPVVGWAHAGAAKDYEEMPESWQRNVPTECRDPRAFAVELEGDSMQPEFRAGSVLVLMPEAEPYSGCLVVARFVAGGVMFRRLEISGERYVLAPLNERYSVETHPAEAFAWIYPVWGVWRQTWKQ